MAEFNLFGNATGKEIKVGYISTERGLVDNITVCEANDYAKLNPGTQFIFKTREFTKYMNINGVNKLTPEDLEPKQGCDGIETDKECGPPGVQFSGGGGVGVKGNPVIGEDGAVLAVDLVSGGFGYQYPPIVEVKDNCGIGAGGYFKAVVGEIVETEIIYDQAEDFEEYEICTPEDDINFGRRYGPDGKDLGPWEPTLYANLKDDPIRREIQKYQDFLTQKTKPWWTTRKQDPLSVTGERGTSRKKYNVDHGGWGDFMNKFAISPKPKSNASGSDFAGIPYTFVWEEDFPYDGEYVFRGAKDNKAEFYLDGVFVSKLDHFNGATNPIKKTLKSGVHQLRVDLLNVPIKEKVIVQQQTEEENQVSGVDFIKKSKGYYMTVGGNDEVEVSLQLYYKDDPNIAGTAITKITIPNPSGDPIILQREKSGKSWKKRGSVSGKSVFKKSEIGYGPIQFEGNVKDPILEERNTAYGPNSPKYGKLKFIDNHGDDTNGRLSIVGSKNLQESTIKKSGTTHSSTSTQELEIHKVFNTIDYIDKANRQLWRTNVFQRGGFINQYGVCPFDTALNLEDNPYAGVHRIVWDNINFPIDGNYDIGVQVDDNVTLTIIGGGKEEVITKKGFAGDTDTSTGKSSYVRSFLKGSYKIIADLEQIPGGRFSFKKDKDGSSKQIKDVNFKVTSNAGRANKIIIKELFSLGKEHKGNQLNQILTRQVEVGKEYEVTLTSNGSDRGVRLRTRDGEKQLQMEEWRDNDWNDIVCTASEGQFYALSGNKCRFRIKAEPAKGINPMALAINIESLFTEKEVISPKSWNENPMGVALTIDAPMPPIPQEPLVDAPGRCPRNPMWSTRFPNAEKKWFPVRISDETGKAWGHEAGGWSDFLNRYGVSPVIPSSDPNSSGGGTLFSNTWDVEVPYSGWYKLKAEVDDIGKIYINNELKIDLSRRKDKIREKSDLFFLEGGEGVTHKIKVECENYKFDTFKLIDKKIFSTADWAVKQTKTTQTGIVDVTFNTTSDAGFANAITIDGLLSESKTYKGPQINSRTTAKVEIGKVYNVTVTSAQSRSGVRLRDKDGSILQMEEHTDNDWGDIQCSATQGKFYDFINGANKATCKFVVEGKSTNTGGLDAGVAKGGVTYSGPKLATYRSSGLGADLTPAWKDDIDYRANFMGKTWTSTWKNIYFPEDGQYDIKALADDTLSVKLDGVEIVTAKVFDDVETKQFNSTKGYRTLEMTYNNIPGDATSTFATNPVYFAVQITKKMNVTTGQTKSWTDNPIGISAVLIPPPCPKKVKGKGVITDIVVDDPGNGFPRPSGEGYPVTLQLEDIEILDTGGNYNCEEDEIIIEPSFGAELSIKGNCENFGRIRNVDIVDPGLGFTQWPNIRIKSKTGINFEAVPKFKVVRTPPDVDPDKLVQVTDLVGLKQTGYYKGKPYYGAVFYQDGIRYAGWYPTPGESVQIYATMQESIDAMVTTPPSAILRQGSDTSSNDPRLNIPGTPENLL